MAAGQTLWALATSLGVVALLVASEPVFLAVKYAGAAYLVLLGLQALRAALFPAPAKPAGAVAGRARRMTPAAAWRQGLVSNLGNPKMAVFFASLLPQFLPMEGANVLDVLALGLVFCATTFIWLAAYALLVAKAGEVLLRPRVKRVIEGVTGAVLIALDFGWRSNGDRLSFWLRCGGDRSWRRQLCYDTCGCEFRRIL